MKEVVSVTARGRGVWGRPLDVELATSTTTRFASDGQRSHVVVHYVINTSDPAIGSRTFGTEAERASFSAAAFSELQLTPVEPSEDRERAHPLVELVGSRLLAVTFVEDHLQLQFDAGTINEAVWPRVRRGDEILRRTSSGYADALISLIHVRIAAVDEVLDLGLVLAFENDTRLTVPLDGTEVREAADFHGKQGGMIWRPAGADITWLPELS